MGNDKRVFGIDLGRCTGCYACVVACMDQNDAGADAADMLRDVTEVVYAGPNTQKPGYVSLACMHCDDAPCAKGCPAGCLRKTPDGLVVYEASLCIGCHSCLMGCPYGAIKVGADGKIRKCDGCSVRVENGLVPACVRVCPTKALKFDTPESLDRLEKGRLLKKDSAP